MATTTRDPGLTRAQLIKVVRTDQAIKGVGKMRALASLQTPERRDVGDIFVEVVADKDEEPRFRHMAVLGLYKMGGARADEALAGISRNADEVSAPTIATALGRVGAAKRLRTIERLEGVAAPHARARTTFAATLLAYRHGLEGHEVRAPAGSALQDLGRRRSHSVAIAKARGDLANRALAALAEEPLDLDLTTEGALRIVCEPNTFAWVWTKDVAAKGFAALADRKGVAGVLFRRRRHENAFALSAFGLGTPVRGGVRLTVHRAEQGIILYSGLVASDGKVELKARNHPGLAAVAISGRVEAGRVEVTRAKSAAAVREAKTPKAA
jgi:hypothetical protein